MANQVIKAFLLGTELPYMEDGKGKSYAIIVNPASEPVTINIPQNNYFKVIARGLDTRTFRKQWEVTEYLSQLLGGKKHVEKN